MQLLYSMDAANDSAAFKNPVNVLDKKFSKTRELLVFLINNIVSISKYAETAARLRASKNIPTEEDLNVNTKIAGNQLLWQIIEDKTYRDAVEEYKTDLMGDIEITRKLYLQLVETTEYQRYILEQSRDKKNEIEMLAFLFNNIMLQSDVFVSYLEDKFDNLDDDAEMVQSLVNAYLHKPQSLTFASVIDSDKWNFAKTLLTTCLEKKEHLLEILTPKFTNWDADRIASLDMIILKMGISELLYFETIPTKVTINEYIDLAKEYSTQQSGQFVNGILDSLHKDFLAAGKINKVDFRKAKR